MRGSLSKMLSGVLVLLGCFAYLWALQQENNHLQFLQDRPVTTNLISGAIGFCFGVPILAVVIGRLADSGRGSEVESQIWSTASSVEDILGEWSPVFYVDRDAFRTDDMQKSKAGFDRIRSSMDAAKAYRFEPHNAGTLVRELTMGIDAAYSNAFLGYVDLHQESMFHHSVIMDRLAQVRFEIERCRSVPSAERISALVAAVEQLLLKSIPGESPALSRSDLWWRRPSPA